MNGQAMLALQRIDTALHSLVNRRARLPELAVLAEATATRDAVVARAAAAQERVDTALATVDATEKASAELTRKRTRLEGQLKTIIAPREAEALMHEIDAINTWRGELDDRELEALEEQAAAESALAAAEGELPECAAAVDTAEQSLAAARAVVDTEASGHEALRPAAAGALTTEELATYERMRARLDGVAVASLDGLRCSGCHLDLSRAEVDELKRLPAGTFGECPQCGRLLVH